MSLTVPPRHVVGIKALLELPDDKLNALLEVLRDAEPQFNVEDLAESVSEKAGLSSVLTESILDAVASVYRTFDPNSPASQVNDFLEHGVRPALKKANLFPAETEETKWKKFKNFFEAVFSFERSVGTTIKAGPVLTEHERIFDRAKIMTDLRPIYHRDVTEKPDAALVIHMLKITQRDSRDRRTDLCFALDTRDIRALKEAIDRALEKEGTIRRVMTDAGVKVLNAKPTY
jgi:hypothetical protein